VTFYLGGLITDCIIRLLSLDRRLASEKVFLQQLQKVYFYGTLKIGHMDTWFSGVAPGYAGTPK